MNPHGYGQQPQYPYDQQQGYEQYPQYGQVPPQQSFIPSQGVFQASYFQPAQSAFGTTPTFQQQPGYGYPQTYPVGPPPAIPGTNPYYGPPAPQQPQQAPQHQQSGFYSQPQATQGYQQQPAYGAPSAYPQIMPSRPVGGSTAYPSFGPPPSIPVPTHAPTFTTTGPVGSIAIRTQGEIEAQARQLRQAMRGIGTDDSTVVQILGNNSNADNAALCSVYYRLYSRTLQDALSGDLSGKYRDLAISLVDSHDRHASKLIRKATVTGSRDPEAVLEILTTRTPAEMDAIKRAYENPEVIPGKKVKDKAPRKFVEDIIGAFSGNTKKLVTILMLNSPRPTTPGNPATATSDAQALIRAAKGAGTDEGTFFEILGTKSYSHLRLVASEVQKLRGKSLEALIASEFSGTQKRALIAIVDCALYSPQRAYARTIRHSVKGAGTYDDILIRTIASRYDIDMKAICDAYRDLFPGRDLLRDVEDDTSFNYKKLLRNLIDFGCKKTAGRP